MALPIKIDRNSIAAFCRKWQITEFALFGSVLRSDFGPQSDVDVLVTFDEAAPWSLWDIVAMQDELALIFQRKVDLVEKRAIKNPFRRQSILSSYEVAGIFDRGGTGPNVFAGYNAFISPSGFVAINESDATPSSVIERTIQTSLDPINKDVLLELVAQDREVSLRAWEVGSPRPNQPLLMFTDDTPLTAGHIGIFVEDNLSQTVPASVAFRSFTSIPEPPTMMLSAFFFAGVFAWQWRRSR